MTIRSDILGQLADYRGILQWDTYTEAFSGMKIPNLQIPLYINQASIPVRKPKVTEITTVPTFEPGSFISTRTNGLFFGSPDILQTELTGWTVTPVLNSQWAPVDANSNPLNWGQLSYNDIICYFIEGRLNRNTKGAWQRKDPDFYITPTGQTYIAPLIAVFQPEATPVMKKQAFEMTLYLEK